jgi:UDP-N-acetyl-D-mannosaminuronate dehydrogenase
MNTLKVAIIGLGYVGLPLAVEFGKLRSVVGFDINVSSINFCLKALVEKGWNEMGSLSKNSDKINPAYLLTFTDVTQKAVMTLRFL